MKIGVIQASSQAGKNRLIYDTVKKYAEGSEVINFGCTEDEPERYSYIEISILAGMLLAVPVFATLYALIQEWVEKKNALPETLS